MKTDFLYLQQKQSYRKSVYFSSAFPFLTEIHVSYLYTFFVLGQDYVVLKTPSPLPVPDTGGEEALPDHFTVVQLFKLFKQVTPISPFRQCSLTCFCSFPSVSKCFHTSCKKQTKKVEKRHTSSCTALKQHAGLQDNTNGPFALFFSQKFALFFYHNKI